MKLMTDKKYVLYYNCLTEVYNYSLTYNNYESVEFWSKRIPVIYSNSLTIIILTINKLNKEMFT